MNMDPNGHNHALDEKFITFVTKKETLVEIANDNDIDLNSPINLGEMDIIVLKLILLIWFDWNIHNDFYPTLLRMIAKGHDFGRKSTDPYSPIMQLLKPVRRDTLSLFFIKKIKSHSNDKKNIRYMYYLTKAFEYGMLVTNLTEGEFSFIPWALVSEQWVSLINFYTQSNCSISRKQLIVFVERVDEDGNLSFESFPQRR